MKIIRPPVNPAQAKSGKILKSVPGNLN